MARTVKSIIQEFYEKRDPRDKNYAVIDAAWLANAANLTGSDITKVRAMDILNDARIALYEEFALLYTPERLAIELSGIIKSTTITWTLAGSVSTAPKPTDGYLSLVDMVTATGVQMVRQPLVLAPVVRQGVNRHYIQSASKLFIFEEDTQFKHYGTYVTSGSTYEIRYFRLYPWTVGNMEAGILTETINDQHHPLLIELMILLSNEYSGRDLGSFIRRYVKG